MARRRYHLVTAGAGRATLLGAALFSATVLAGGPAALAAPTPLSDSPFRNAARTALATVPFDADRSKAVERPDLRLAQSDDPTKAFLRKLLDAQPAAPRGDARAERPPTHPAAMKVEPKRPAAGAPVDKAPETHTERALEERRPGVFLRVSGNLLTLEAKKAPLQEVLLAISEVAGFEAKLSGNLTAPVAVHFSDMPVNEAMNRLLRGLTHAERYAKSEPDIPGRRVVETWVLGPRGAVVSSTAVIGNRPAADPQAPGS